MLAVFCYILGERIGYKKKELHMTQQERLRYLVEGLVAEYNERHNEHIEIPMNEDRV